MKVAVYGKQFQQDVAPFVYELFLELEKAQMEVLVYEPFYNFLSKQIDLNLFLGTYNSYEELKNNVSWTPRAELQNLVLIVLVFSLLFSLAIWGADTILSRIVKIYLNIING